MSAGRPGRSLRLVLRGEGLRRSLFAVAALACLSLYLWPALKGPVVLWSDSRIDLDWAAKGAGIFGPAPPLPPGEDAAHPLKPGYLLFLRTAMALSPFEDTRTVVVLQSLLLVLSVVAVSLHLARKRGSLVGVGFLFLFLLFLRTRNAASAVMPETITAVLLLACAAFLLEPPRRLGMFALPGFLAGVLFGVRPNAGAIALLLLLLRFAFSRRRFRATAMILAGFAVPFLTFWIATRTASGHDATRGLSFSILEGSADYYWRPSLGFSPAEVERRDSAEEIRLAAANWKRTLSASGPDARRQLFWRAFHGFLGTEYYDARWSPPYHAANSAAMILAPFLILACVALCLALPFSGGEPSLELLPAVLLGALFFQNLLLGSNPRYVLPFLPVLFLLLLQGLPALVERGRGRIGSLLPSSP